MDAGRIVEQGSPQDALGNPQHPRTRLLPTDDFRSYWA